MPAVRQLGGRPVTSDYKTSTVILYKFLNDSWTPSRTPLVDAQQDTARERPAGVLLRMAEVGVGLSSILAVSVQLDRHHRKGF